jgi:hypothetical protein
LLLSADHWPKQPEPSTDVFCDLLPETKEGIRVDSRDTRIIKQAQVLLTLKPATDDYYDPLCTIFGRCRDCLTRRTTGRSSLGLFSQVSTTSSCKGPVDNRTSSANSPGFEARGRT